jgi:hypothetical protein
MTEEGCGRLFTLVMGFALLLVFALPTAAFALFMGDVVAFVIACALTACGLFLIDRAVRS